MAGARKRRKAPKSKWLKELRKAGAEPSRQYRELVLHKAIARFLDTRLPKTIPYTHFPAGERRDPRTAAKLKAMGLKPGWPDFQLILPNGQFGGLEAKTDDGDLSDDQADLHELLCWLKCGIAVVRSVDDVERVLTRWLAKFGMTLLPVDEGA